MGNKKLTPAQRAEALEDSIWLDFLFHVLTAKAIYAGGAMIPPEETNPTKLDALAVELGEWLKGICTGYWTNDKLTTKGALRSAMSCPRNTNTLLLSGNEYLKRSKKRG
jgi:hypothetical protein